MYKCFFLGEKETGRDVPGPRIRRVHQRVPGVPEPEPAGPTGRLLQAAGESAVRGGRAAQDLCHHHLPQRGLVHPHQVPVPAVSRQTTGGLERNVLDQCCGCTL